MSASRAARDSGVSGIVCVDKPEGLTSRAVVDIVGRVFRTRKVGHAGTLDRWPLACCWSASARGPASYRGCNREPRAIAAVSVGSISDTDDRTGKVVEHPLTEPPSEQMLREALLPFHGLVPQVPPAFYGGACRRPTSS